MKNKNNGVKGKGQSRVNTVYQTKCVILQTKTPGNRMISGGSLERMTGIEPA